MATDAYSTQQVRKSLLHFLGGRTITAAIGVLLLLSLVRVLDKSEYGAYIALTALFEIVQLSTNLGAYAAVYRYIPELRVGHAYAQLERLTRQLLGFRCLTLTVGIGALVLASGTAESFIGIKGISLAVRWYGLVILFEGLARFIDSIYESMLMQGVTQVSILLRNGIRLLASAAFLFFPFLGTLELVSWIKIEAIASGVGATVSMLFLLRHLADLRQVEAVEHSGPPVEISLLRMGSFAVPTYLAQVLGLAQGPDMAKILIARISDAVQTGAFGFAAVLNAMLQRYLPVFLLIGMVRPLFVAARQNGKGHNELIGMASLLFKGNLFLLAPAAAVCCLSGDAIAGLLSGGKFPDAGRYLFALILLLGFQTLHAVMGLLALVAEESKASLRGTIWGLAGIGLAVIAAPYIGPLSVCAGLILSEVMWCLSMNSALAGRQMAFKTDVSGLVKISVAAILGAVQMWVVLRWPPTDLLTVNLLVGALACAFGYLASAWVLKPFTEQERALINKALPRPVFVW